MIFEVKGSVYKRTDGSFVIDHPMFGQKTYQAHETGTPEMYQAVLEYIEANPDMVMDEPPYQPPKPTEAELRARRDSLLSASDKYLLPDFPISDEKRAAIMAYRQALRDLPDQPGWPDIEFPKEP